MRVTDGLASHWYYYLSNEHRGQEVLVWVEDIYKKYIQPHGESLARIDSDLFWRKRELNYIACELPSYPSLIFHMEFKINSYIFFYLLSLIPWVEISREFGVSWSPFRFCTVIYHQANYVITWYYKFCYSFSQEGLDIKFYVLPTTVEYIYIYMCMCVCMYVRMAVGTVLTTV